MKINLNFLLLFNVCSLLFMLTFSDVDIIILFLMEEFFNLFIKPASLLIFLLGLGFTYIFFFNIRYYFYNFFYFDKNQKSNFDEFFAYANIDTLWAIGHAMTGNIFTTNHKRIAINYYWFVILSGSVGMGLATAIRFELAYPGLGIFAGDSLQYLSVVTAHGVIMVFFMIMPLLFGAFGNFLLPTQLGVHDVAFPRLNSAAFWFLPAGFLMLGQLLCIDRRYQRMNCFNIREAQSLLKREFFTDLVNSNDHRDLLTSTMINYRYKAGSKTPLEPNFSNFINYGTSIFSLQSELNLDTNTSSVLIDDCMSFGSELNDGFEVTNHFSLVNNSIIFNALNLRPSNWLLNFVYVKNIIVTNTNFINFSSFPKTTTLDNFKLKSYDDLYFNLFVTQKPVSFLIDKGFYYLLNNNTTSYISYLYSWVFDSYRHNFYRFKAVNYANESRNESFKLHGHESTSEIRVTQIFEPLWRYDFRCGNYLKDNHIIHQWLKPVVFTSFANFRLPNWFLADDVLKPFLDLINFSNSNLESSEYLSDSFLNFPFTDINSVLLLSLNSNFSVMNFHWVSLNNMEIKFHNMFFSVLLQERIYSNWRSLKFSREAWRCKLLAARHQETMYRRYISEESLMWSLERNAKDLLPGWAMVTPFSARTRYTAVGKTDLGLMGVLIVLNSSIVSSANFLVTYRYLSTLNNRKMRDARSFFTEGLMVASWMMIAANPMLAIGIMMLLSDRHWQTSFFDYSGGGDTVLFQHMFWFFGHPEVYVIMIPVFGFTNTILSYYLRKRISARLSLMYSIYTIAFLGFFVWGHHMYMVGLSHTTRMLFSTLTVMISVPAATKLMHWSVTLVNSSVTMEIPLLFTFIFIFFFISGGISGMAVAHTGMDILFHDSFYVIGHFHVMLAGSAMFGSFSAFYFYFPAMFGLKFSRLFAYTHFIYYILGQLLTVIPMMWVGYAGMPRRILDYPSTLGGWHSIISAGHMLSVAGLLSFFFMIADSKRQSKVWVPTTALGVGRFNTRVLFYRYEFNRHQFMADRVSSISHADLIKSHKTGYNYYKNNEYIDLTPVTYSFHI